MSELPVFYCTSGPQKGQRAIIDEKGLRIGRDATNEIPLDDNGVSRHHGRVLLHSGLVWIQDLGSRNGIFVNDRRVQNQEQLNPRDRVQIGSTTFELRIEGMDAAPAVVAPPVAQAFVPQGMGYAEPASGAPVAQGKPRKRVRLLPLLIVAIIVSLLIGAIALLGSGTKAASIPSSKNDAVDPVLDLLRSTTQDHTEQATANAAGAAKESPATVGGFASILADSPAEGKAIKENWPPPPAGASSPELVEKGHQLYRANRLHDALIAYHQGLTLDSTCEICKRRIDRVSTEIEQSIRQQFDSGLRYYNSLQYEQAITAWETVLLLSPNPESQPHKQAKEYMEKAQANMKRQY